jgi:hypothetical protein
LLLQPLLGFSGDDERRRFFCPALLVDVANDRQRRCDEMILRDPRAFKWVCETAWLTSSGEAKPSTVRIFWLDILTVDGFFGAKFDILRPRWLPTAGVAFDRRR